jgi:hypothetical protein
MNIEQLAREVSKYGTSGHIYQLYQRQPRLLEIFAALVRNEALEEAAVKCDSVYYEHLGPEYGEVRYGISASAAAIRSMKEVKT